MILEFPIKFSVEIKTKTWALIGQLEIYAGKQLNKINLPWSEVPLAI